MRLFLFSIAFMFTNFVTAQTISADMAADTRKLLELTGAQKMGEQMGDTISQQIIVAMRNQNANVPDGVADIVTDVVRTHISEFINSDETEMGLVEIYARHYTHDDILALTDFYNTPVGKKVVALSPQIAQETGQFGQALFLQRLPQLQKDIQDRLLASGLVQQQPAQQSPQE